MFLILLSSRSPLMIILSLLIITISCLIIWRSSHAFEVASDYLGRKLPMGIKGATLNAIASSMPEFLTTIFFLFYLNDPEGFSGGLGVTSGSALYNLLIIPSMAILSLLFLKKNERIKLDKRVLLREGVVLILSQVLFVVFLFNGILTGRKGLFMVLIYLVYLAWLYRITQKRPMDDPGFETPEDTRHRPLILKALLLDLTHAILNGRQMNRRLAWMMLLASTIIMTLGTWLLVLGTDKFGEYTGIPLVFAAVILSAIATSIPDTIISIKDARKGNYDDAVSNALGSNIFDIAFALGLPVLLYNLIYGKTIKLEGDLLQFTQELWVFLILATALAMTIMIVGKYFNRFKAYLLMIIYLFFILFVGTQVHKDEMEMGRKIFEFLTRLAELTGELVP